MRKKLWGHESPLSLFKLCKCQWDYCKSKKPGVTELKTGQKLELLRFKSPVLKWPWEALLEVSLGTSTMWISRVLHVYVAPFLTKWNWRVSDSLLMSETQQREVCVSWEFLQPGTNLRGPGEPIIVGQSKDAGPWQSLWEHMLSQ